MIEGTVSLSLLCRTVAELCSILEIKYSQKDVLGPSLCHGRMSVQEEGMIFLRLNCSTEVVRAPDSPFFLGLWSPGPQKPLL